MVNKKVFSTLVMAIISICAAYGTLHADGNAYIVKPDANSIEITRKPVSSKGGLDEATRLKVAELYGSLPLSFIRNDGQLDERVRYYEKGSGHTTYFTKRGVHWELVGGSNKRKIEGAHPGVGELTQNLRSAMIRIAPLGTGKSCDLVAEGLLSGKVNYLKGTDPKKWQTSIPTYESVVYKNIYDGIDMKFYGNNRQMEYDIIVHPGVSPSRVQFMYEGIEDLKITEGGDLEIKLREEDRVIQKRPYVYQEIDGKRVEVGCVYAILDRKTLSVNHAEKSDADNRYGKRFITAFKVSSYNKRYPLVIDPVLEYSTYLGGSRQDSGSDIAVDSSGNAYVTGLTDSTDFPMASPLDGSYNGGNSDAFVSKLNASGTALVYSTYLGGSNLDHGSGIAVDSSGNAYVTGDTSSTNFPMASPLDGSFNGGNSDAFVSKITDGLQPTPTTTPTATTTVTPTPTLISSPTPTPTPTQGVKGKISGFVADTGGNPIDSAKVKAKGVETKIIKKTFSDAAGFFEFAGLEADTYKITVKKKGYKKAKEKITLEEGEEREITIEIKEKE